MSSSSNNQTQLPQSSVSSNHSTEEQTSNHEAKTTDPITSSQPETAGESTDASRPIAPPVPEPNNSGQLEKRGRDKPVHKPMVARWLKERFNEGPYHIIGTVKPAPCGSKPQPSDINSGSSSLGYYDPQEEGNGEKGQGQ